MLKEIIGGLVEIAKDLVKDIPPKHKVLELCALGLVGIAGMAAYGDDGRNEVVLPQSALSDSDSDEE